MAGGETPPGNGEHIVEGQITYGPDVSKNGAPLNPGTEGFSDISENDMDKIDREIAKQEYIQKLFSDFGYPLNKLPVFEKDFLIGFFNQFDENNSENMSLRRAIKGYSRLSYVEKIDFIRQFNHGYAETSEVEKEIKKIREDSIYAMKEVEDQYQKENAIKNIEDQYQKENTIKNIENQYQKNIR